MCVESQKGIWSSGVINMSVFSDVFDMDPFDEVFFMLPFGGIFGLGNIFELEEFSDKQYGFINYQKYHEPQSSQQVSAIE